jgi:hypothetical protein
VTVNQNKEWKIVEGLPLSDQTKKMLEITGAGLSFADRGPMLSISKIFSPKNWGKIGVLTLMDHNIDFKEKGEK